MRKNDLCLSSEGAEVILATSSDEKHPPESMIDGNPDTFWTTTGMFPQEFIICFHKHVRIERLVIQSYFVRTLRIEKSTSKEPVDFEPWIERGMCLFFASIILIMKEYCPLILYFQFDCILVEKDDSCDLFRAQKNSGLNTRLLFHLLVMQLLPC
uniref:Intraflagellar transport 25 n=1 Tax=Panthera leo TaxID=9689 RepID=A0A8C8XU26_PANLE